MILIFEQEKLKQKAEQLGLQLNLPATFAPDFVPSSGDCPEELALVLTHERLEVRKFNSPTKPFFIDFASNELDFRIRHGGRKKEALAKAVGLKKNRNPVIFDLTAGLGRDAFILASFGCQVHLFERNKIVSALLADGLRRAAGSNLSATTKLITFHRGDALNLLKKTVQTIRPDVIYLDPMFPHRTKSAKVKKEMRIIREIVGDDRDADVLFKEAIKHTRERVVCKRPKQAPLLSEFSPDMNISSKKHRFDVYFKQRGADD